MRNRSLAIAAVLFASGSTSPAAIAAQGAPASQGTLTLNAPVRRTLAAGASHSWQLRTAAARFVVIEVETSVVDVVLRVLDAAGRVVREIDGPGSEGIEMARLLTNAAGTWTVHVVPFEAEGAGEYEIRWLTERAPTPDDLLTLRLDSLISDAEEAYGQGTRAGREQAIAFWSQAVALYGRRGDRVGEGRMLNHIGDVHFVLGRPDSALAYYARALPIRRAVGDRSGEATTLNNIGNVHFGLGRPDTALAYYAHALQTQRAVGDRLGEARTLSNIGVVHGNLGRPDSALASYARALPIQRGIGDRVGVARTLNSIGNVHIGLGRPDSALAYYAEALPMQMEIGDRSGEATTLHSIGFVHRGLGRPDSALAYYARALAIRRVVGDRSGEAATLNSIGRVHTGLGRSDSALAYYAQALPISRAVGDRSGEAATLNNIGFVHNGLGRPDSALAYYAQALPILRVIGDRSSEAATLNNIGNVHIDLGRPDSALAYYTLTLPVHRAVGDRSGEATTLNNIGFVHNDLGRPDSALAYYAQALSILRAIGDRSSEALTLNNIGNVYIGLGRPDSALPYYSQALPISRAVGDRGGEATTLQNIGAVHFQEGRPDSALAYYTQALPIVRAVGDRSLEATTLSNIAALSHYGFSPPDLRSAVVHYDSAAAARSSIAERAGGDQNRLSYAERGVPLFQQWTLAWLALGDEIGPERSALAALAAAERGRAQSLLDLMRRSAPQGRGSIGAGGASVGPGADMVEEGRRLARQLARSGSSALYYLVTRDTLLIWFIGPQGVDVFRGNVTERELAADVAELRRALGADSAAVRTRLVLRFAPDLEGVDRGLGIGPGGSAEVVSRRLAARLIPPGLVEKMAAGELVIVPHGPLNLVPFAALPVDTTGEPLGARYSLRYAPSLATLAELAPASDGAPVRGRGAALLVGNPAMPRVRRYTGDEITLSALPGAEAEAQWVAGQTGATLLSAGAATEAEVKRRLPSANLIHLATHGYAYSSEARARDSFIALAPTSDEDGLLTVGEVLDELPLLSAELVVLSACQTGLGDLKQAEGTVGLQRAFLAKGARSVLVSLWSVSDEATEQLMRNFYTHWLGGASKAEALRRAQAEVRGEPGSRFHHPRYWAAFQLVGAS